MFGLKIIRKKKYDEMQEQFAILGKKLGELVSVGTKYEYQSRGLEEKINGLNETISDLRKSISDRDNTIKQLKDNLKLKLDKHFNTCFDVVECNNKCDLCDHETYFCVKYVFDKKAVCVVPKGVFKKESKKSSK